MTVSSATREPTPFDGNDVTTAFPFTFKVFLTSDVALTHEDADGEQTALVLDSDYSVALNPDQDANPGGTITYPLSGDPLPDGERLIVVSDVPYEQGTSIANLTRFPPRTLENAYDYLTALIQQLLGRLRRTISFPPGDSASGTLPSAANRAGKVLVFDDDGNADVGENNFASMVAAAAASVAASAASAAASAVSAAASAASAVAAAVSEAQAAAIVLGNFLQSGAGAAIRTFTAKARELYTGRDFGAVADDATNDASALQAAQDAVSTRYTVDLGNGVYRLRPGAVSPFYFGNLTTFLVYRAVAVDKSNLTFKGGRVHISSRASVASGDVQPAFATAKNAVVGTLENIAFDSVEFNTENDADASNSNQRGVYLTGIRGLRFTDTVGMSTGNRRGYFGHIQNCENVIITGHYHRKVTGGFNFRFCKNVVLANSVFDDFSEAIDFDGASWRATLSNLAFRSTARTNQCMDLNSLVDSTISNIVLDTVGNIATITYKTTTPPTYADYLTYSTWAASTAVTLGQKVINGNDKYECSVAGTTAAAGGPTGTGSGIVDGTAQWNYLSAPFDLTPTERVTITGVSGQAIGATNTASFIIGLDWSAQSHVGFNPVTDITLSDMALYDVSWIQVWEAKRLTLRNLKLTDMITASAGKEGIDMLSATGTDDKTEWSDLDVTLENIEINGCDRGAVSAAAPSRLIVRGLKVRGANTLGTSEPDLRVTSMEARAAFVDLNGLDVKDVTLNGDSTTVATWAALTAYRKNKVLKNGSSFYLCTTGGTSAGAGGPTGTAASITDGTCVWQYLNQPYSVNWGDHNRVSGTFTLQGDAHKFIHGKTLEYDLGDFAATGTVTQDLFVAKRRCYVARATYSTAAAVAADAVNYRILGINSSQGGAAFASIAQANTQAGWAAIAEVDGGFTVVEVGAILNPGDEVQFSTSHQGTGRALTGLMVQLEVLDL